MNIIILFPNFDFGGVGKKISQLAKSLQTESQVNRIICVFDKSIDTKGILELKEHSKIRVFIKEESMFSFLSYSFYSLLICFFYKPKKILAFLDIAAIIAVFYKIIFKKTYVVIIEDALTSMYTRYHQDAVKTWLMLNCYKLADLIIAVSTSVKQEIIELINVPVSKIRVIPNWSEFIVDTNQLFGRKKEIDFLFVGRFEKQKNIYLLLEILKLISSQRYLCVIAGQGTLQSEIVLFINKNKLEEKVKIIRSPIDVKKYLYNSKYLLVTSEYEGLPLIAVEAMSVGTPVISSDFLGVKDIITHQKDGFICSTKNEFVIQCKQCLVYESSKYLALQKSAIEKAKRNFSKNNLQRYIDILLSK